MAKLALLVELDSKDVSSLANLLVSNHYEIVVAPHWLNAIEILKNKSVDLLISHLPAQGSSPLIFFQSSKSLEIARPNWIILYQEITAHFLDTCLHLGVPDFVSIPMNLEKIQAILDRMIQRTQKPILEIIDVMNNLVGFCLGADKRSLIESRVLRRSLKLGLQTFDQYIDYFRRNRPLEISELISLMTTHTTSFFREATQFDFLVDHVLPRLNLQEGPLRIWSAACSSGEEVYSLALTLSEYSQSRSLNGKGLQFEIIGSDVDAISVGFAKNGVYPRTRLKGMNQSLISRYFETGTREFAGLVKVKDSVHRRCKLKTVNLLASVYPVQKVHIIFLRNVLIYFSKETIHRIVSNLSQYLLEPGLLFLGSSEGLREMSKGEEKLPYRSLGHSIYQLKRCDTRILSERSSTPVERPTQPQSAVSQVKSTVPNAVVAQFNDALVFIGCSTGGVEALKIILTGFPKSCPPIIVVQHISGAFSGLFAQRLNSLCNIGVSEARDGDLIAPGHAYIAPGGHQMKIKRLSDGRLRLEVNDDPAVNSHKPSVDYLLKSALPLVAQYRVTAAILTGMGSDGAEGLKLLKDCGAHTIAQDEKSSIVFGMPKVAIEKGAAVEIVSLERIGERILGSFTGKRKAA